MIYFYIDNGRITRMGDIPEWEAETASLPGESWVSADGWVDNTAHRVVDGVVEALPTQPSIYHVWNWDSGEWVGDPDAVDKARTAAKTSIDLAAGVARQRYITTTPGQDATYTVKYAEAKSYRDAGYPDDTTGFPFIAGESSPNAARTPCEAADRIIQLGDMWSGFIGPSIERIRVNGKDLLDGLTTLEEIDNHTEAVVAALNNV